MSYLANVAGPVPLVLDLRIAHERFGSTSDPSLNGHLHYPNDIDKLLNEAAGRVSGPERGVECQCPCSRTRSNNEVAHAWSVP